MSDSATTSPTLATALADAGYGYRASHLPQRREVFRISDGDVVGQFEAHEAWDFLRGLTL